jgi:BA14K-like protein
MKKVIAMGLAAALATATVGTTTSTAQANTGGIVTGIFIGLGVAALVHHFHPLATTAYAYYPAYGAYPASSHVGWCQSHYRSYNAATDTFIGYDGLPHRCAAPY